MARKTPKPLTPAVLHILLALATTERHGYGIMKQVEAESQGKTSGECTTGSQGRAALPSWRNWSGTERSWPWPGVKPSSPGPLMTDDRATKRYRKLYANEDLPEPSDLLGPTGPEGTRIATLES